MSKQTSRRVRSSIDTLPSPIRTEFDRRLAANKETFIELSEWLKDEGYEISKSAIGRYSRASVISAERVSESLRQTQVVAQAVAAHPDLDYTSAAQIVFVDGLMRRISTAEEEFDELPLDKAGRLLASLARNATYEKRVRAELKKKMELAFEQLEAELMTAIKQHPDLAGELHDVLARAREKVLVDAEN